MKSADAQNFVLFKQGFGPIQGNLLNIKTKNQTILPDELGQGKSIMAVSNRRIDAKIS